MHWSTALLRSHFLMMCNLIYNYPCLQLNKHIYVNKWSSNIAETRFSGGAYYRSLKYVSSMEWYRHFQHDWCLRLFRLKTRSFFATLKQRRNVRVNPSLYLNWRPLPFQQEMLQHSEYVFHLKMTKKKIFQYFFLSINNFIIQVLRKNNFLNVF